MLVTDIHHVSLNVSDTARSLGFYRDLLGPVELPRPDLPFPGAWPDAGAGCQTHLIEADVPADLGQHVAFRVTSLDVVIGRLCRTGVSVGDPRSVGDTGIRQAFTSDPGGNRVEFTQPLA